MINQYLDQANNITMPVPAAAAVVSGQPLVFGRGTSPGFGLAGVAENDYTPPTGIPTGNVGVKFCGAFFLSVVGKDAISGSSLAIAPGDKIYADGGTYDVTTGCLYGFTLNGNKTTGVYFGNALTAVVSGQTTTIPVRLKVSGD